MCFQFNATSSLSSTASNSTSRSVYGISTCRSPAMSRPPLSANKVGFPAKVDGAWALVIDKGSSGMLLDDARSVMETNLCLRSVILMESPLKCTNEFCVLVSDPRSLCLCLCLCLSLSLSLCLSLSLSLSLPLSLSLSLSTRQILAPRTPGRIKPPHAGHQRWNRENMIEVKASPVSGALMTPASPKRNTSITSVATTYSEFLVIDFF